MYVLHHVPQDVHLLGRASALGLGKDFIEMRYLLDFCAHRKALALAYDAVCPK